MSHGEGVHSAQKTLKKETLLVRSRMSFAAGGSLCINRRNASI
jgi:hypothetical protein